MRRSRAGSFSSASSHASSVARNGPELRHRLARAPILERLALEPQRPLDRVARQPQVARDRADRLPLHQPPPANLADRFHAQHPSSPHAAGSSRTGYGVVNFGRRLPPEPGQNCTPVYSHGFILVSKLVHATFQTTPPHRSTSITEASTLLSVALELTLSIGILPRGLHRLSFPSVAKDQSSRVPQNSL